MPLPDQLEYTLQKIIKVRKASFLTAHAGVNDSKYASGWTQVLNEEGGEDVNNRISVKMEQK